MKNSQSNNEISDKIALKYKTFKENLFKVYNDHTADEKTSNEYGDGELINLNLVSTATNASNLSSINKSNSNSCDITNAYEEKTVETVLANSVPISAPDKEANLCLVETIDSTIDQFKEVIEKARKLIVDNDFTVKERAHSGSKKSEDKAEETNTWRKVTTLIMGDSILSQIREDKLCKKGTIKVRCFPGAKFEDFYHYAIPLINKKPDRIVLHMGTNNAPYCTPEKMVDQILGLKNFILQKLPTCEIIISTPTLRTDNTTANNRNNLFVNHLKKLNIKLILNDNIEKKHLNYRELHLRMSGVIKLSENLVKSIHV